MARIASKLERAVRALLVVEGPATFNDCFISNDARTRTLPNRTILAHAQNPARVTHRPEGEVHFSIQHHFAAMDQPADVPGESRVNMDAYVEDTEALLFGVSDDNSLSQLADLITAAGRWLAVPDGSAAGNLIAEQNADMVNFRCDWVKLASPYLTRGPAGKNEENIAWVESLNLIAGCSIAAN